MLEMTRQLEDRYTQTCPMHAYKRNGTTYRTASHVVGWPCCFINASISILVAALKQLALLAVSYRASARSWRSTGFSQDDPLGAPLVPLGGMVMAMLLLVCDDEGLR